MDAQEPASSADRPESRRRKPLAQASRTAGTAREELLADAYSLLGSTLDHESTLAQLVRLVVPTLADWCAVDLLEEGPMLRRLAAAHADPAKRELARRLEGRFPVDPDAPWGPARVVRTGKVELYRQVTDPRMVSLGREARDVPTILALGAASAVCVPLTVHGRTLGVLSLVSATPSRAYSPADLSLVGVLARRAAGAIEHARLYAAERRARQAAERAAERTARLQAVTAALAEALAPAEVAQVIVEQGMGALGAVAGVVAVVGEGGEELGLLSAAGYPDALLEAWTRIPLDAATPFADALATGEPVFLESREARAARYPEFARLAGLPEAAAIVPLILRGRAVGVLQFGFGAFRAFLPDEQAFALTLGRQCAQALERARLYEAERRARADAEAANRTKDQFLATLSHELRTPLTALLGWVRLLRAGKLDPPTAARALESIERNVRVQAQLINDILDISRVVTGKLRLELQPVDVATVVGAAIEAIRPAAEAKGIHVATELDPTTPPISGDPDRLQQVVWNLLANAVKFTATGGRVEVRLSRAVSHVEIRVRDTGEGIPPAFLPYVFDRFRQADTATTRAHTGLGLGLAIVRHLVELHGGTVAAESRGDGQGATFTVTLPVPAVFLTRGELLVRSPSAGEPGSGAAAVLEGRRILVVDDDPDALELVTAILSRAGAAVAAVLSAREARAAFEHFRPDVLVCDIAMPGEDGYAVIRELRARDPGRGATIPAVALTAYASLDDRERALSAGFHAHVTKPVDPTDLVNLVAGLARPRRPEG